MRVLRQLGYESTYELGGTLDDWNQAKLKVAKRR